MGANLPNIRDPSTKKKTEFNFLNGDKSGKNFS